MAVTLVVSESLNGAAFSDALEGGGTGIDLGSVINGQYTPIVNQPTNDGHQDIFNVGAGQPQAINRLVELLGGEVVHVPKRPGEPDCTWADITKIRRQLGWAPAVSFEEGVRVMLGRINDWRAAPVWDEASIETATTTWFRYLT